MALIHEKLSDQFYEWEVRGRGWDVFPNRVRPEPPFRPFEGHHIDEAEIIDDGRRPTILSSLIQKFSDALQSSPPPLSKPEEPEEPAPESFEHDDLVELRATLPVKLNIAREVCGEFLANLSFCQKPISFEIVGSHEKIVLQFACDRADAHIIRRQLDAHFPDGTFTESECELETDWTGSPHDEALVVEFGLAREFMFQLRTEKADPFIGIVGALSGLQDGEIGVFQVIFEPVRANWSESIEYSTCHADGKPFFVNATELAAAAKWKILQSLYAAVMRVGVLSGSFERTLSIARDLAGSFRVFSNPTGNELIPLDNEGYPYEEHVGDLLRRNSRRSGMILTSDELVGFVHLPSSAVQSPFLLREFGKTKAAPNIVRNVSGVALGVNRHAGETAKVSLTPEHRVRHMHLIGASGTGKSTLLFNLIRQDIENGQGIALLDPHGDLVDRILGIIPENRIDDVIYVDPSDEKFSVGFNILSAHSDLEKNLLASDLVGIFERLSTSWGDQMGSVLRNAILAFLESDRGGTLADLRRFLIELPYRNEFLATVRDPDIVYYWRKAFPQLAGNKSIGSVLTRLETFLAPKPIRYMVSQKENRLDFTEIMDSGKIFLAKLPRGEMGEENSFLLGSFFVAKFQQAAMARQRQERADRRDYWLYLDEFPNFMTPSMAEILSGARKYRLGLILAHQDLGQLQGDRKIASAVLSNPFTRVIFRVGDADARNLESGLSFFEAKDLQNLEIGQAVCRVEKANGDFNLSVIFEGDQDGDSGRERRKAVISESRKKYATSRNDIESALRVAEENSGNTAEKRQPKQNEAPAISPVSPAKSEPVKPERTQQPDSEPIVFSDAAKAALTAKTGNVSPNTSDERIEQNLGQGGARHKIIQKRIKEAAESIGFSATIEKPVPKSDKRFDVFLERANVSIACEISFTTTIDHEIGNIAKCFKANVVTVAVICLEQNRLRKIKEAVLGTFTESDADRVLYFDPSSFFDYLQTLATPGPTKVRKHGSRTVKRSQAAVNPDERAAREAEYHRAIAEHLKNKSP